MPSEVEANIYHVFGHAISTILGKSVPPRA